MHPFIQLNQNTPLLSPTSNTFSSHVIFQGHAKPHFSQQILQNFPQQIIFNSTPSLSFPNQQLLQNYAAYNTMQSVQQMSLKNTQISNASPIVDNNAIVNHEINKFLLAWKLESNYQAEVFKNELRQLAEIQKSLNLKLASVQNKSSESVLTETKADSSVKDPEQILLSTSLSKQIIPKKALKNQIRTIIQYLLANVGRTSESQLEEEQTKYQENKDLFEVFGALTEKYASTIKTKEEMIKYILRKTFKFIKGELKKETNTDAKGVSNLLCKKYFSAYTDKLVSIENEEDFLKFLLPFR